ncbi:MAG: zinc dependent phospholipase C family protein [Candidatus Binatia bacterium]
MIFFSLCVVVLITVLYPHWALAWGPVTHIVHGSEVFSHLTSLPAALQAIVGAHQNRYLYGCIGADIVQAKAYTRSLASHCHSWTVAWTLLRNARDDGQKAFAWGYMTHLAADIVSHNHFVPTYLLRSFASRTSGHAYWEARADGLQRKRYWRTARRVLENSYEDCDDLVERSIDHTLFSFKTNKRIFDSLMGISKLEQWQTMVNAVNRRSRYALTRSTVDRYNEACLRSVMDLLNNKRHSYTQNQDATGREVLQRSTALRRRLRQLKRKRKLPPGTEHEVIRQMLEELPQLIPPG